MRHAGVRSRTGVANKLEALLGERKDPQTITAGDLQRLLDAIFKGVRQGQLA